MMHGPIYIRKLNILTMHYSTTYGVERDTVWTQIASGWGLDSFHAIVIPEIVGSLINYLI